MTPPTALGEFEIASFLVIGQKNRFSVKVGKLLYHCVVRNSRFKRKKSIKTFIVIGLKKKRRSYLDWMLI